MQIRFYIPPVETEKFDIWLRKTVTDLGFTLNTTGPSFGLLDYDFSGGGLEGYVTALHGPEGEYFQVSLTDASDSATLGYARACDALLTSAWRQQFGRYEVLP